MALYSTAKSQWAATAASSNSQSLLVDGWSACIDSSLLATHANATINTIINFTMNSPIVWATQLDLLCACLSPSRSTTPRLMASPRTTLMIMIIVAYLTNDIEMYDRMGNADGQRVIRVYPKQISIIQK